MELEMILQYIMTNKSLSFQFLEDHSASMIGNELMFYV